MSEPHELIHIYINIMKLEFFEELEYDLYIIIFNYIFQRFEISCENKQKTV